MQACLSAIDARHANRHAVEYQVIAQHRRLGEFPLSIGNISASGFLGTHVPTLRKGDRLAMRLPIIGWIEAHVVWASDERAGFQFERLIRTDDFADLLAALDSDRGRQSGSANDERGTRPRAVRAWADQTTFSDQ